ncbi:MAG: hypothetical protein IAF58_05545 [Leptolyngbya sp.]|nr:hypothetical protein [Candidatus Melainabacteria bacterium]
MFSQAKHSSGSGKTREIKEWVRKFASVPEDFAILVTELKCTEPGCPPLETIVALLGSENRKYQQKVHLSIEQIGEIDAKKISEQLQRQLENKEESVERHNEH